METNYITDDAEYFTKNYTSKKIRQGRKTILHQFDNISNGFVWCRTVDSCNFCCINLASNIFSSIFRDGCSNMADEEMGTIRKHGSNSALHRQLHIQCQHHLPVAVNRLAGIPLQEKNSFRKIIGGDKK